MRIDLEAALEAALDAQFEVDLEDVLEDDVLLQCSYVHPKPSVTIVMAVRIEFPKRRWRRTMQYMESRPCAVVCIGRVVGTGIRIVRFQYPVEIGTAVSEPDPLWIHASMRADRGVSILKLLPAR